jgi:hypothetical protein
MDDKHISVRDVADQHGKRKQTVFKVLKRLGIGTVKHRNESSRNQLIAYIDIRELKRVSDALTAIEERNYDGSNRPNCEESQFSPEIGEFYVIQLEPQLDAGRFEVGFASAMNERLRHLRCSAPFARVIRTWPCRRLWERTAIDASTVDCDQLHTEVFRTRSIEAVLARCEQFFSAMPPVTSIDQNPQIPCDELHAPT